MSKSELTEHFEKVCESMGLTFIDVTPDNPPILTGGITTQDTHCHTGDANNKKCIPN